jgi:hypothetical protein
LTTVYRRNAGRKLRALFTAKAEAAVVQTVNKPFKADRDFHQLTTQRINHAVNHGRRNQRFTNSNLFAPLWAMLEQVVDRHGQVVVRVHQPAGVTIP